jgi:DNA-directed RNA polymerase specialized sigma24 family protein
MSMASGESVTHWLDQLQAGDHAAAEKLWERYFHRLVGLARARLRGAARRAADEEDVALSAFDSFCRGAEHGRFPELINRDNLWRLLVVITARKAFDLVHKEGLRKRGGGAVLDEAALQTPLGSSAADMGLAQFLSQEPSPDFAAQVAEQCQRLLGSLNSAELQNLALAKMEGYTTEEIARQMECAPRTVERKLRLIRQIWAKEMTS